MLLPPRLPPVYHLVEIVAMIELFELWYLTLATGLKGSLVGILKNSERSDLPCLKMTTTLQQAAHEQQYLTVIMRRRLRGNTMVSNAD